MKELRTDNLAGQILNSAVVVAFAPDGRLWRVIPTSGAVFIDSSTDYGKTYSKAVRINPADQRISAWAENPPVIAISQSGRIHVLYYADEQQKTTSFFTYSDNNGQTFSKPVLISDRAETARHYMAQMLVDKNNKVYMFWHDTRHAQQESDFHAGVGALSLYYIETDQPDSGKFINRSISAGICSCCRTAVAFSPEDKPVILARMVFPGDIRDHALIKMAADRQWEKPKRVTFDDWKIEACPEHGPAMAIDSLSRVHLAWFTLGDKHQGIFYSYTDDYGKTVSKTIALGEASRLPSHPEVMTADDGRVALAWKEFDGEKTSIFVKQSTDRGVTWSESRKMLSTTADSGHPKLISHKGKIFLSWISSDIGHHFIEI